MIAEMLRSSNPLVKYGIAVTVVFGPLYVLQSYGSRWAWPFALTVGAWFLVKAFGAEGLSFGRFSGDEAVRRM